MPAKQPCVCISYPGSERCPEHGDEVRSRNLLVSLRDYPEDDPQMLRSRDVRRVVDDLKAVRKDERTRIAAALRRDAAKSRGLHGVDRAECVEAVADALDRDWPWEPLDRAFGGDGGSR